MNLMEAAQHIETPPVDIWLLSTAGVLLSSKALEKTVILTLNATDRFRSSKNDEAQLPRIDHDHIKLVSDINYHRYPQTQQQAAEEEVFDGWMHYLDKNPDLAEVLSH